MFKKYLWTVFLFCSLIMFSACADAKIKGIYLTQYTLENTAFLNYLIKHAKAAGIDTFVVDLELPSKRYEQNIALLKQNNITYVARIIMFPDGASSKQVEDPAIWQR